MGSEGPRNNVTIHVTGFKKFQGVPENPTEIIVSKLKDHLASKELPPGVNLGSCTILDTAGDGARAALYKILEDSVKTQDSSGNDTIVWLHFGVNSGAHKFAIEQQAVNEATFRCPDELGWQPQQIPIVHEDGETSRMRKAFTSAWSQACSTDRSVFLVPEGRSYLVNATRFAGPCAKSLSIRIEGTIVAPDEPANWDPKLSRIWLNFHNLTGVSFRGRGVIDGSGSKWWAASCKKNKSNPCKGAPTALTISSSSAIKIQGLTIQNSQQMHFVISHCNSVRVSNVQVSAPEDSPNTDGIHISESANVVLQNCKIGTGDDCVSIVNASSNIKMKTIYCGPGHGISIGSLGKDNSTAIVTSVVLSGAFIKDATNGVRIKTWQGGSGYVKAVRFENVRMESVANPIIIDQFYCDSPKTCINQTSAVEISQIMYRNISGTTKSKQAMKFACSDTVPCSNIILDNVNLEKEDGTAEVYCNSATGIGHGVIHPSADCLTSTTDKDCDSVQVKDVEVEDSVEENIIHTEL